MEAMPSPLCEEDLLFLGEHEQQLPWVTLPCIPKKLYSHQQLSY